MSSRGGCATLSCAGGGSSYVRGMEAQLGALGFMVNVIVLWNSLYTGAALEVIEGLGGAVSAVDVERLTPLKWAHINMLGRYEFVVSPDVLDGDLRPLRDPNAGIVDELAA